MKENKQKKYPYEPYSDKWEENKELGVIIEVPTPFYINVDEGNFSFLDFYVDTRGDSDDNNEDEEEDENLEEET